MSGFTQWCWPDGKSLIEQDNLLLEGFQIIKSEAEAELNG